MLLEVQQLHKKFGSGEKAAVNNISLQLASGQVGALLGRSGSGKTTLLRLLAGLEQPDAGFILFKGETVKGPDEKLVAGHRSIRLVHQHFELAHRLSVYDNVAQKLRHLRRDDQEQQTIEILETCRLLPLKTKMVEELSGGEKQRLALGRALAEEPELLLLDEPFSNLDPGLKDEIRRELFEYIRRQGISAILVSHDPQDALSQADCIWVLQQGKLVQEGKPEEIYYGADSSAIAALFGSINVFSKNQVAAIWQGGARERIAGIAGNCLLGIRPELIEPAGERENAHFKAVVTKITFQGPYREISLRLNAGLILQAYLPTHYSLRVGEALDFRLRLEHLLFWPNELP